MRKAGWVGRRERAEGWQVRIGSVGGVVGVEDEDEGEEGRGCCWVGRVRSAVMRLRRVRRGRVGIGVVGGVGGGRCLMFHLWYGSVTSDTVQSLETQSVRRMSSLLLRA